MGKIQSYRNLANNIDEPQNQKQLITKAREVAMGDDVESQNYFWEQMMTLFKNGIKFTSMLNDLIDFAIITDNEKRLKDIALIINGLIMECDKLEDPAKRYANVFINDLKIRLGIAGLQEILDKILDFKKKTILICTVFFKVRSTTS